MIDMIRNNDQLPLWACTGEWEVLIDMVDQEAEGFMLKFYLCVLAPKKLTF